MRKEELNFLRKRASKVPENGVIVEIGSWTGGSAVAMSEGIRKKWSRALLHCVDPFDVDYFRAVPGLRDALLKYKESPLEIFKRRMAFYPYTLLRMTSKDAVNQFADASVDFIFIDGNHTYEYVKQDIELWWPKVKCGGMMSGHDYGEGGVSRAVDERFGVLRSVVDTVWSVKKPR